MDTLYPLDLPTLIATHVIYPSLYILNQLQHRGA
jgi:hypothetical protein